jgi:hypothetical protein
LLHARRIPLSRNRARRSRNGGRPAKRPRLKTHRF